MKRILWQADKAYGLCTGLQGHWLVTGNGVERYQGACDCMERSGGKTESVPKAKGKG